MDHKLFKILGALLVVLGALAGVLIFLKKRKCCKHFCYEADLSEDAPQETPCEDAPAAPAEDEA